MKIDIELELEIEYAKSGRYRPATHTDPAEHEEREVLKVMIIDQDDNDKVTKIDIMHLLNSSQIDEIQGAVDEDDGNDEYGRG